MKWSDKEIKILREVYPEMGLEHVCELLDRPKTQVRPKLSVLGIKKNKDGVHHRKAMHKVREIAKARIGTKRPEHSRVMKEKAKEGVFHWQKHPPKTHGLSYEKGYYIWNGIMQRCYNKKKKDPYYYGRGIGVCDEWHDVRAFVEWFNKNYKEGLTIDRINTDGGYSPENCRFCNHKEQNRNKRNTKVTSEELVELVSLFGKLSQKEIAKRFGITYKYVNSLFNKYRRELL